MNKKLNKNELFSIIQEVESEFSDVLSNIASQNILSKSEESEESEKDKKVKEDKKDKEEDYEEENEKEEDKEEDEEEDEEKMKKSEIDYSEEDFSQELNNLYTSMSKSELALHAESLQNVLKSEKTLNKSEQSVTLEEVIAKKDEKIEGLEKSLDRLLSSFNKFIGNDEAPASKAITSLDFVAKSEELNSKNIDWTPQKIHAKLETLSKSSNTSRTDRESINDYYLNGKNLESIKHLLG